MKKLTTLLFMLFMLSAVTVKAQLSGYVTQDFESTTFPPSDWTVQNIAGPTYTWARSTAQAHNSNASAFIRYDSGAGGGLDWLISPQYSVVTGDSVVFWMRLAFSGFQPDSLCIKISTTTNDVASFTTTILKLREGTDYPPNAAAWYRYAVSMDPFAGQDVYVAFKHYNANGDGLYIDDVAIGTRPPYNAATTAIATPALVGSGPVVPSAVIQNRGNFTETFDVTAEITPGGYTSTTAVTALASGADLTVNTFAPWTPAGPGTYIMKVYTQLPTDMDHLDDTLYKTINVLGAIPEYGWEASTPLPAAKWGHATAFSKLCAAGTDTAYQYVISGNDAAMATVATCFRQNLTTGLWSPIAPIPAARQQISAVEIGGKIYVPGGYASAFAPNNMLQIYDISTNTWSAGATLPTAVGDYAISAYADSLIYVIGGYNGSADVNLVQIYNVNTNTWTAGTPKTGIATAGGRMGIANGKIVYLGGYSQTLAATQSAALLGTIDPVNPAVITWFSLPDSPLGTSGRFAAGGAFDNDRVYFAGGDPDGAGTATLVTTAAYNTATDGWEVGPNKITGVGNVSNFTMLITNDSMYMSVTGGYNGSAVVSANEWLNIGAYAPSVAAAGDDFSICDPGTAELSASGGTSYEWSPAAMLDNAFIATPVASLTETDTFYVNIVRHFGCPVLDTVIVTVNLSDNSSQSIEICFGETYSVGTSVYDENGVYVDILSTLAGCDSTVTTTLTVREQNIESVSATVCAHEGYVIDGVTYTVSGTYPHVYQDANGCDSTVITSLTVQSSDSTVSAVDNVLSVDLIPMGSTAQWYDCETDLPVQGATGSSFAPAENGSYYLVTDGFCGFTTLCTEISTIGIEENHSQVFAEVFPNPGNESFTIRTLMKGTVTLSNELGQIIDTIVLNGSEYLYDAGKLKSGVYTLSGTADGKILIKRIVILH